MKRVVVLGGGGGGVVVASRLSKWMKGVADITLVDRNPYYEFRPSYLWVATGLREPDDIRRSLKLFQNRGVKVLEQEVVAVDPANRTVKTDKTSLSYDYLVVSLGADLRPDLLPGNQYIHHAWDLKGALGLREALSNFKKGRIIVGPSSSPYMCPPAPFELALMARYLSDQRGVSDKTDVTVIHPTWKEPMEPFGLFMQNLFKDFLGQYGVKFLGGWELDRVDGEGKRLVSKRGDELKYDLAVVIPPHVPAKPVSDAPELISKTSGYMNIDKKTLRSPKFDDVFGIGDVVAPTLEIGMAGVFAHFEGDYVAAQIADEIKGVYMATTYNKVGVCVMDIGYLGAAVFCDFSKVIDGESKYPDCWVLGGMKAFKMTKVMFERMWLAHLFGR